MCLNDIPLWIPVDVSVLPKGMEESDFDPKHTFPHYITLILRMYGSNKGNGRIGVILAVNMQWDGYWKLLSHH